MRYDYLWSRRAKSGADTADKARPACILLAMSRHDRDVEVLLLPITHSPPAAGDIGVEIPSSVKQALGLDAARSWIVVTDSNQDLWPSPDLQQIPGHPGCFHYGHLPPRLFRAVRDAFLAAYRDRRVAVTNRTEGDPT